ncbi:hypothetical protein, partial [Kocuria rosea]|uniref:hypothetical protein n=1 Tax=Kocuria rosea TaxID=1275 RepID=UPI001643CAA2
SHSTNAATVAVVGALYSQPQSLIPLPLPPSVYNNPSFLTLPLIPHFPHLLNHTPTTLTLPLYPLPPERHLHNPYHFLP